MQKLNPNDPETMSADIVSENLKQLKALFPEAFVEGKVDFDVLKQLLGGAVDEREEKYGLNWHGKRKARQLALTPSTGTLRPCPQDSVDWDTTQNLMIEGDNLEVLKLLEKSFAGRVKLIYIDPPYNTGKDFVYRDDYRDNIHNYLQITGQLGDDGGRITNNTESAGRFHTDWLNMMYPRLKLARNMLREDGIVFISVDNSEVTNLRAIADEVFGPDNFLACIVWKKRSSPDARTIIGTIHDYILCYTRTIEAARSAVSKMLLTEERKAAYTNPDNDPRGPWASVDMTGQTGRAPASQYYDVVLPSGRTIGPPDGRAWGISLTTFNEMRDDNRIWFGLGGDNVPRMKRFLEESEGQVVPSFWDLSEVGSNDEAKKEVNELMAKPEVFDTPKPLRLIQRILQISTTPDSDDIVMDFFAGSGTTGHAVFAQNASDGGSRRFILVQLPEPLTPEKKEQKVASDFCDAISKPRSIAELTKERLRRAQKIVKADSPLFTGDLGFRVFKLDTSNLAPWDTETQDVEQTLLSAVTNVREDRTESDILCELLLKLGLDLCVPIGTREISGKAVQSVGAGALFVCLAPKIDRSEVESLALGIVEWHKELDPAGESSMVFLDSAFADDVSKTNMTAILGQHGLLKVRSL